MDSEKLSARQYHHARQLADSPERQEQKANNESSTYRGPQARSAREGYKGSTPECGSDVSGRNDLLKCESRNAVVTLARHALLIDLQ